MGRQLSWDNWISVITPAHWTCVEDQDSGVITLLSTKTGLGALQFSFATHPVPTEPQEYVVEVLVDFVKARRGTATPIEVGHVNNVWVGHTEVSTQEDYWEVWLLSTASKRFLATYNCDLMDRSVEAEEYRQIMSTVQVL